MSFYKIFGIADKRRVFQESQMSAEYCRILLAGLFNSLLFYVGNLLFGERQSLIEFFQFGRDLVNRNRPLISYRLRLIV